MVGTKRLLMNFASQANFSVIEPSLPNVLNDVARTRRERKQREIEIVKELSDGLKCLTAGRPAVGMKNQT
jgi:hypothetical protein